jgi:hypothetical protein
MCAVQMYRSLIVHRVFRTNKAAYSNAVEPKSFSLLTTETTIGNDRNAFSFTGNTRYLLL